MELALMTPEVSSSRVLRTDAARDTSVRVMASSPRLLIPDEP